MNHTVLNPSYINQSETFMVRRAVQSDKAEVWTDLYQDDVNIATWQRTLSSDLIAAAQQILAKDHLFRISTSVTPEDTFDSLYETLGSNDAAQVISQDITEIIRMFCYLFDLKEVGLT